MNEFTSTTFPNDCVRYEGATTTVGIDWVYGYILAGLGLTLSIWYSESGLIKAPCFSWVS